MNKLKNTFPLMLFNSGEPLQILESSGGQKNNLYDWPCATSLDGGFPSDLARGVMRLCARPDLRLGPCKVCKNLKIRIIQIFNMNFNDIIDDFA